MIPEGRVLIDTTKSFVYKEGELKGVIVASRLSGLSPEDGLRVLHAIVDILRVIGEPISMFKEAVERETGILMEVDTYDWITFMPMSDVTGAYNRYFGRMSRAR